MQKFEKNRTAGFSLPEILIVLIVIAIIIAFAIPQLTASMHLNKINTGAALVASKISEAKMEAIKRNQKVSIVIDELNDLVWIEANSNIIGAVKELPTGSRVKISPDTSAIQEKITFNSVGTLTTQPATISVFNPAERVEKKININLTGKISVAEMNKY